MKYFAVLAALATSALAQSIAIGAPVANSTVYPGQWVTVEVDKPDSLTGSTEVAVVLSTTPCPDAGCNAPGFDPSQRLGTVLYNGPYNPQFHPEAGVGKPPHQNFSVPIPSSYTPGEQIYLIATHVNLVGAGPFANLETKYITLDIVQAP